MANSTSARTAYLVFHNGHLAAMEWTEPKANQLAGRLCKERGGEWRVVGPVKSGELDYAEEYPVGPDYGPPAKYIPGRGQAKPPVFQDLDAEWRYYNG